jgi:hypothetical protein
MSTQSQLNARRLEILDQISKIKTMRKGSLNAKYNEAVTKSGEVARTGPYYVITGKGPGNKTISKSISTADVPHIRQEVNNYKEFRRLTDEYIEACEKLSLLEGACDAKKN